MTIANAGVATVSSGSDVTTVDGNVLGSQVAELTASAFNAGVAFTPGSGGGTGTYPVAVVGQSSTASTIVITGRGVINVVKSTIPFYKTSSGTVNNIEDLPASPADGTTYTVLGTAADRQMVTAIYSTVESQWLYQPVGRSSETVTISYVNPYSGINIPMQDFAAFKGNPRTPLYWSKSELIADPTFSYTLEDVQVEDIVPIGATIWRWKVSDLPDPGEGSYSLTSWAETSGSGPTWASNYSPLVKKRTTFNISKNKTMDQRSILFSHKKVHHLTMQADVPTPFTVIIAGIIQSYPTAKYGHYLLDSGKATAVRDLTGGKDYFFKEGTNPRQVMLFMKRTARMGTNTDPTGDMKTHPNIKIAHSEKPRPRMFYGVFDGSSSRFGAIDTQYRFEGSGALDDLGTHHYWCIGRRVNRVSDNRSTHLSLWDVAIVHDAMTQDEINAYYENIANEYQFKEYS